MLIGVFQLLQAKRAEVEAGQRYIEALTDYWIGRTELERSVGGELRLATAPASADVPTVPGDDDAPAAHPHHHHGG
jgi:cobalt-zinc-cadmium efflux system outer membrane protein